MGKGGLVHELECGIKTGVLLYTQTELCKHVSTNFDTDCSQYQGGTGSFYLWGIDCYVPFFFFNTNPVLNI